MKKEDPEYTTKVEELREKFGRDGKYDGVLSITKIAHTISETLELPAKKGKERSKSVPTRELQPDAPDVEEIISSYERFALSVVQAAGIEFNEPYRFNDCYQVDKNHRGNIIALIDKHIFGGDPSSKK